MRTFWKPRREHVLQKPADELPYAQGGNATGIALGVAVAESDLAVFETEDVSIADGHAKDIGGIWGHS